MKRLLIGCLALTAVFVMARNLNAAPIVITDTTSLMEDRTIEETDLLSFGGGQVNALHYPLDWVGWTHQLEFLPPVSQISSATLTLSVIDDPNLEASGTEREYNLAVLEDGTWGFTEVSTFAYTFQIDISSLLDQKFSAFVYSLGGDFLIESSSLEVLYNPVPVPSTIILLASSSFALMVLRLRRRKS